MTERKLSFCMLISELLNQIISHSLLRISTYMTYRMMRFGYANSVLVFHLSHLGIACY